MTTNMSNVFLLTTTTLAQTQTNRQNCSTFNPCGNRGYCIDNQTNQDNDVWSCECKFWWEGRTCEYQTATGKQIIAFGIVTGILILFYYTLEIIRCICNKKQGKVNITNNKIKNSSMKTIDNSFNNEKKSIFRCSSLLIVLLMIIIVTIALIIRWIIIRPIHNDIINKFFSQMPIYYIQNSFCSYVTNQSINIFTLPAACLLIIIFIIVSKRISFKRYTCRGYIAPIVPVSFFIHSKRTFATVIFAIISNHLLDIFYESLTQQTDTNKGAIIIFLEDLAIVFVICVCYYPMLAAVYIDTIFTLTCGTIYTWLYFIITILYQGYCQNSYYPSESVYQQTNSSITIMSYLLYYGTGSNLIIIQLCIDIPRYLCLAYISIRLPIMLIDKISQYRQNKQKYKLKQTLEEQALFFAAQPYSIERLYVRNLFRSVNIHCRSRSFIARLIPKSIYEWRDDFRFSSRILCLYAAIFLILFFLTTQLIIQQLPNLLFWQTMIQIWIDSTSENFVTTNQINTPQKQTITSFPVPSLEIPFLIAVFTALIITIIQLFVLLATIRRHLLQIFHGNRKEIAKRDSLSNIFYATFDLHFAGFFISYVISGYILCFLLAFVIYMIIDVMIIQNGAKLIEQILKAIIPGLILGLLKVHLDIFFAKYIVLQQWGKIFAINHYRITMIILYFNFFLDTFLGFIASISRIITNILMTIIYMSRLDYSPLGRQLESWDAGFCAYSGFIQMEAVHRNPIMLAFASILLVDQKITKQNNKLSSKTKQKWHLAILLIHNPSLVTMRKAILAQKERNLKLLETITTSERDHHSMNIDFQNKLTSILRSEYVSHGRIQSTNPNIICSKL